MVSWQPMQTDKALMVGLTTDPLSGDSYSSIDYALYCTSAGQLYAYENGTRIDLAAAPPSYAAGDTLQVTYDGTSIRYLRNGVTLLQRTVAISAALYADSSFSSVGGKLTALQFGKAGLAGVTTPGGFNF